MEFVITAFFNFNLATKISSLCLSSYQISVWPSDQTPVISENRNLATRRTRPNLLVTTKKRWSAISGSGILGHPAPCESVWASLGPIQVWQQQGADWCGISSDTDFFIGYLDTLLLFGSFWFTRGTYSYPHFLTQAESSDQIFKIRSGENFLWVCGFLYKVKKAYLQEELTWECHRIPLCLFASVTGPTTQLQITGRRWMTCKIFFGGHEIDSDWILVLSKPKKYF